MRFEVLWQSITCFIIVRDNCNTIVFYISMVNQGISGLLNITPVSYTHLDVYKRQTQARVLSHCERGDTRLKVRSRIFARGRKRSEATWCGHGV